jgi:hypothetical protein
MLYGLWTPMVSAAEVLGVCYTFLDILSLVKILQRFLKVPDVEEADGQARHNVSILRIQPASR